MSEISLEDQKVLAAAFARLDMRAMAIAVGAVFALGLFFATAALLLQDVAPGEVVGTNLGALGKYLPGYTVSWVGSVVGLIYGFVGGMVFGAILGFFWNLAHHLALGIIVLKSTVFSD